MSSDVAGDMHQQILLEMARRELADTTKSEQDRVTAARERLAENGVEGDDVDRIINAAIIQMEGYA